MRRRALLQSSAAAVGGGAAALAGLHLAGDAEAQAALTLDVVGDSATVGADETVTAVTLTVTVEWAVTLPETASPETVTVELAAGADGDAPTVVASAERATLFTEADGEESFEVDLLGDVLDAAALTPDNGTRETPVTIEARLRVTDGAGDPLARATASDQATVTVTRESVAAAEYGRVGGTGSLTIATE